VNATAPVTDPWSLATRRGPIRMPAFLPDATRGTVRAVDADDLRSVGVTTLMTSAFHLSRRPGARRVQRLGGIHRFNGWDGPIVTDSGGFQVFSLIRQNPGNGAIRENGVIFRDADTGKREWFTPERSIRAQLQLGSDVLIAFDDCTGLTETREDLEASVARTVKWFRQARLELERQAEQQRLSELPPLVGVVQGGSDDELRTACAQALVELGADAFGFGGWPIDAEGRLQFEQFVTLDAALPPLAPLFALGVGKPEHLVRVATLGRPVIFDCSLPTRDARKHRLYVRLPGTEPDVDGAFYSTLYILDAKHAGDERPLSEVCDAPCCRRYSRAYLHHLAKVGDSLGDRLATLHNLRLYTQLVEELGRRQ
jgi:queuine tRNA-ribosyltransferase